MDNSQWKIYTAGPMRGYPDHNIPAFKQAATHLRSLGFVVVSPVEIGIEWTKSESQTAFKAEEYLVKDIYAILEKECNAIALLPGWENSVGAKLEAAIALTLGFKFFSADGTPMSPPSKIEITGGYNDQNLYSIKHLPE